MASKRNRILSGVCAYAMAFASTVAPIKAGAVSFSGFNTGWNFNPCGVSVPVPACSAGATTVAFEIDGANNEFNSSNVNLTNDAQGYKLYLSRCFGQGVTPANFTLNNSSVTVGDNTGGYQAGLSTADCHSSGTPNGFVGTAFNGGTGPTYYEIKASFNNDNSPGAADWMAPGWTFSLEAEINNPTFLPNTYWSGQTPPYFNFFEGDLIEYFRNKYGSGIGTYSSTGHNWWGPTTSSNNDQALTNVTPGGWNPNTPHYYGMLIKPATVSVPGSITWYYDRAAEGSISYQQFLNNGGQVPPPTGQNWEYGVVDLMHQNFLTGCPNAPNQCTIYSMYVYQASTANNIHY